MLLSEENLYYWWEKKVVCEDAGASKDKKREFRAVNVNPDKVEVKITED